jgi:hypothetical protein
MAIDVVLEVSSSGTVTIYITSGANTNFRTLGGIRIFYYTA